jgi:cysteinyl-tRNA synthetase
MHNGLLQMADEKMSRSLGNLITIRRALEICSSDAIHIFVLGSYYRSPLAFSEASLEAAERGAERLRQAVRDEKRAEKSSGSIDAETYRKKFIEAMDDDFNTAQAIALLFDLARDINRADESGKDAGHAREVLRELGGVLGLTFEAGKEPPLDKEPFAEMSKSTIAQLRREKLEDIINKVTANPDSEDVEGYINLLAGLRNALREHKKYQLADEIRNKLGVLGIVLEDNPQGTTWKRKR